MKKLTIALLGVFAISTQTYAQSGSIGTVLDTIQILQDINDMLGNGSSDDGYYDSYGYGDDGYGNPPPRPDYGYRHRPQPYPEQGEGYYEGPRHRMGYPDGPRDRMGRSDMENHDGHSGIIGRPDRRGRPEGRQGRFDTSQENHHEGMIGRPERKENHEHPRIRTEDGEDRNSGFSGRIRDRGHSGYDTDNRQDSSFKHNNRRAEGPSGYRQVDSSHQDGIFDGDRHSRNRNRQDGLFGGRGHDRDNRHGSRGGLFGGGHQGESHHRSGMFGGRHHGGYNGGHGSFSGGHHHGGHRGRHGGRR
ncbi:MAG: hypothetical protein KIG68_04235 [Oxalobacter sp.]|nr:hypothetical protein [Oxalobacter sp.]